MTLLDAGAPPSMDALPEPGPPPLLAQMAFWLVIGFVVVNRLIQDVYTLPVGISLHMSDVIMGLLALVWGCWMLSAPRRFPVGMVSALGAALMILLWVAPFLNAGNMTAFELNGAERGLVRGTLYAVLFLATYHLATWRDWARRIMTAVIAMTVVQAVIASYETVTNSTFQMLGSIWRAVGFEVDPRAMRGELEGVGTRLSGELRAYATAPHSLVLAGMLVVGIGVCAVRYFHSDSTRTRRRYLMAILVQFAGLGATSQRTGFVALAAILLLVAVTHTAKLPTAFPLIFGGAIGGFVISMVNPATPRLMLNFFTGQATDHNVEVRMSKYDFIPELLSRRPLIGPGFSTSDPNVVIFDNAYLTELIELGVLGLTLLLAFILVTGNRPFSVYRNAPAEEQPLLLGSMCASVTLLVTMATFDVLSFGQLFPTCIMLMAIGVARTDALRGDPGWALRVAAGTTP